ncbi:MAG: flavodoxin family protein [Deltaproteobacteria bacterium]|jgi:multimeric flavodoxin WrbA|nr:flavodoxin family protein [Deltaproteobacteria bacterium]
MKVTAVLGSPRDNSNSTRLAAEAVMASGARKEEVAKFFLDKLTIKGCRACASCKTGSEVCVINDDLSEVLNSVSKADFVILTAPIYIGDISSQQKTFIDRSFSLLKPDFRTNPQPGRLGQDRKLLFIITQRRPQKSFYGQIIASYVEYFRNMGFNAASFIATDLGEEDIVTTRPELLREVAEIVSGLFNL